MIFVGEVNTVNWTASGATCGSACPNGRSAWEWLLDGNDDSPSPPAWCRDAIDQLLLDRVPINPYIYARRALQPRIDAVAPPERAAESHARLPHWRNG